MNTPYDTSFGSVAYARREALAASLAPAIISFDQLYRAITERFDALEVRLQRLEEVLLPRAPRHVLDASGVADDLIALLRGLSRSEANAVLGLARDLQEEQA